MKILFAKHWQVFLITYGIQFIVPLLVGTSRTLQPYLVKIEISLVFILIVSLFWWLWSVSHTLQQFIEPSIRISTRLLNVAFILPVIYLVFATIYFTKIGMMPLNKPGILVPHIISMICFFFVIGFAAKIIKVAETGRPVSVNDYFGEFFLIFFFPIGIWLLQPRINRIVKSGSISNRQFEIDQGISRQDN
ncbi:MAG TPA: hypothetical protein VK658_02880 [Chryseolinea sp.]|nr:hypothetical protein [Chryseolinea sp.]